MIRYRSKFEKSIAKNSKKGFKYEDPESKLNYTVDKVYNPDFTLPNGIIVEAKGNFRTTYERSKMIHVKKANPEKDIRFLFMDANLKIRKGSKTTYWEWAEKNGFKWAEGDKIPDAWYREKI